LNARTGRYSLRAERSCLLREIGLNATVAGSLTETDCQAGDGRYVDLYRLRAHSEADLSASHASSGFAPHLSLHDAQLNQIEAASQGRLRRKLAPGTYVLAASSAARATGPYELRLSTRERPCQFQNLDAGSPQTGRLTSSDCRLSDVLAEESRSTRVHQYRLRLARPGAFTARLESADFDPDLMIHDCLYRRLDEDNSKAGRGVKTIAVTEPDACLIVLVSSQGVSSGEYTLVTGLAPR